MNDAIDQINEAREGWGDFFDKNPEKAQEYKELLDRQSRAQRILDIPQFTQQELLALTQPKLDSGTLQNWMNRGMLELQRQMKDTGKRRLYRGKDVLTICALQQIRTLGVPIKIANIISRSISVRAFNLIMANGNPMEKHFHMVIFPFNDDWQLINLTEESHEEQLKKLPEAYVVINVDKLINRVMAGLKKYSDEETEDAFNEAEDIQNHEDCSEYDRDYLNKFEKGIAEDTISSNLLRLDEIKIAIEKENRKPTMEEENEIALLNFEIEQAKDILKI